MNVESLLDREDRIGWDIDETLLGHPASEAMMDWIERTAARKKHYLVTFRSHGYEKPERIAADFARSFGRPIDMYGFRGTLTVGNPLYLAFQEAVDARTAGHHFNPTAISDYVEWKGLICQQVGLTVLVDDNTAHVEPGCTRYGVRHIHPDEFL